MVSVFALLIRARRKMTAKEIHRTINEYDRVSFRNIQRDLSELCQNSDACVVYEQTDNRAYHYFIEPDMRKKINLPLSQNSILALFLLKRLQPFFASDARGFSEVFEAFKKLDKSPDQDLFRDLDSNLGSATHMLGEKSGVNLSHEIFTRIINALTYRKKLIIDYTPIRKEEPETDRPICPVKLILSKQSLYLMCISEKYKDKDYYIKICRILRASLSDEKFSVSVSRMKRIEKRLSNSFGILDRDLPKPKNVKLRFREKLVRVLNEKVYHHSQELIRDRKGNAILKMRVPVDHELIKWILSWQDDVEVISPDSLKRELFEFGQRLTKRYFIPDVPFPK